MIVDAHSDLLIELEHAERVDGEQNPLATRWLPALQAGGVGLQVCAIYVDPALPPAEALRQVLRYARSFRMAVEANRDRVYAVESAADLDRLGDGRIGLLLSLEGAASFGEDAWLIDTVGDLGVRMAALTWNERNAFAAGADHDDGVTPLGAELLARLRRRAMVLDLAHASPRTFEDALAQTGHEPVLVSHAGCRAVYDHRRNLTDEQLEALAAREGVLGLMPHPFVVDRGAPTVERFVEHVDHAVAVMGIEHVGLGGDFTRQITRAIGIGDTLSDGVRADAALDGLEGSHHYPALIEALRRHGYGDDAITALSAGNLLRLLRRCLP
jgi:membrane dipeptidase